MRHNRACLSSRHTPTFWSRGGALNQGLLCKWYRIRASAVLAYIPMDSRRKRKWIEPPKGGRMWKGLSHGCVERNSRRKSKRIYIYNSRRCLNCTSTIDNLLERTLTNFPFVTRPHRRSIAVEYRRGVGGNNFLRTLHSTLRPSLPLPRAFTRGRDSYKLQFNSGKKERSRWTNPVEEEEEVVGSSSSSSSSPRGILSRDS